MSAHKKQSKPMLAETPIDLLRSKLALIRNSIFHLRPKNNTRLCGNEGKCFLYEGRKLIAFRISLQCLSTLI